MSAKSARLAAAVGAALVLVSGIMLTLRRTELVPGSSGGMDMSMMSGATQSAISPREGQPLPSFEFIDVDGQKISTESLRGSVVVLNVWASWCGPCKEEMPAFEKLHRQYREQGLRVLGVSIDMTAEDAKQFAREMGVTYPIIHQPRIMSLWGLLGLPTTFIVDRTGILRRMVIGFESPDSFEKSIRALL